MTTKWFDKKLGSDLHASQDEAGVYLVGDMVPDWVRTPDQIGGQQVRVTGAFAGPCPKCGGGPDVRHLNLEGGLSVAECRLDGFVWYTRRAV